MSGNSTSQSGAQTNRMKAVRVHQFGGVEAMTYEDSPQPIPGAGQVLIQVKAAGVGPWDALVRSGQSALRQPLPLILGADLSGAIVGVGPGVSDFQPGEEVFGVTNSLFTGAYAEFAIAETGMIAQKPNRLSFVEAASAPVVAVTAWQMVFDYGKLDSSKRVLIHGAAGGVGAYAVQFARRTGAETLAAAHSEDLDFVRSLRPDKAIDTRTTRFEDFAADVDVVIDTVGGDTLDRSFGVLKPGGVLISIVSEPDPRKAADKNVTAVYFIVTVTSSYLSQIADLFDAGKIAAHLGETLPLSQARLAHEMLAGKPHRPGKIVLTIDGAD